MTAIRPPTDPPFPNRMNHPIYPPTFHANSNGNLSSPSFPPNMVQPPMYPPTTFSSPPPPAIPTTTSPVRPMYPPTASMYSPRMQPPVPPGPVPIVPSSQYTHPGQPTFVPPPPPPPMPYGATTPLVVPSPVNGMPGPNANFIDLLKEKNVISPFAEEIPLPPLLSDENQQMNCSPDVMRCSLNVIPQTKDLLNKSRLPLGLMIHPFKDLDSLSVIQGGKIIRCDQCKSYINPFVTFLDNTRWRCSICSRTNNLPQEFLFDPMSKTYGDPRRRPEVRFGTVEYVATSDYMARPPQPAIYLFLLDVSHNAVQTGYLQSFCDILFENLSALPGDARTMVGFIGFDSQIHFYDLTDRPSGNFHVMIVPDLENLDGKFDDILPMPDSLLVNLAECRTMIESFLNDFPKIYQQNHATDSALGTALQIAGKLLNTTGGRITVLQSRIPNVNPGALNESISKEPTMIAPTSDFYKKLALDYASAQIACDLFVFNSHYVDLATLSGIAKFSGGEVKSYPSFHYHQTPKEVERFENDFRRYLQRKIGFEAVMRLRTSPALSIHTFHGNCFVRSVDLLVLPNVNPDAAFGMQLSIDDALTQYTSVTFQIALLYTSSKGERRIRVHTLALPVSKSLQEIYANADQDAVVSLIAKMAADRSMTSSIVEAREAMTNVACDVIKTVSQNNSASRGNVLLVPQSLRLLPLYMLSMIKSTAFQAATNTKLDDRAYYLDLCKTLPTPYLIRTFYPDLYPLHTIEDKSRIIREGDEEISIPERVHLSFQHIDSHGAYLLDTSEYIYVYIGKAISDHFLQHVFNVTTFSSLQFDAYSLPEYENSLSNKVHQFLTYLIENRSHGVGLHIMREDSPNRYLFTRHLVDDRSQSTMSYHEFLRYIREQIVK